VTPAEYHVTQMDLSGRVRPGKPDIPQHPALPQLTEPICRAFFKLEEALERARVPLRSDWLCVDVGSSPGGWTQSLARRLKLAALAEAEADEEGLVRQRGHVWAVDPGVLEPAAHGSNVTRLPMIAQEAVEALHAGLLTHGAIRSVVRRQANERSAATCVVSEKPEKPESAAPLSESPAQSPKSPSEMVCDGVLTLLKALGLASATSPTLCQPVARDEPGLVDWVVDSVVEFAFSTVECAKLDLLVSDVNMHPGGSMRAIAPMLPLVKPQGWLVLTMKNFAGGKAKFMAELDKVKQQLNELEGRGALTSLTQLHCMQNGQEERTLVVQLG